MKLQFFRQIFEKYLIKNFMKIRPVGAELLHMVGRTDRRDEANSRGAYNSSFGLLCIYVFYACLGTNRDARPV
jgi:hypothetical protein